MGVIYETALGVPRPDLADAYREYSIDGTTFAHKACVQVPVNLVAGEIETHSMKVLKVADVTRASAVASYNRGSIGVGKISFSLAEKGWEVPVADAPVGTVQLNRDVAATYECAAKIEIAYERAFAAMAQNLTTFAVGNKNYSEADTEWADPAADALGDLASAVSGVTVNSGTVPDTIIINAQQYAHLMKNAELRKSFGASIITDGVLRSTIPAMFGLNQLVVSTAVADASAVSDPFAGAMIWNSDYVWVGKLGGSLLGPGAIKKLVYTDDAGDIIVEEYPEPQTRCRVIRARQIGDSVLFNKALGHLIKIG